MPSHRSRKLRGKKEDKRLEHKRERSAEAQALRGDHVRTIKGDWGDPVPIQPTLSDEPVRGRPKRSNNKVCKKNKGGPHIPVYRTPRQMGFRNGFPYFGYRTAGYVCGKCGKDLWRYNPDPPPPSPHNGDHWSTTNIQRRLQLGQDACLCSSCVNREEISDG